MTRRQTRAALLSAWTAVVLFSTARPARAQAWVPPKGEGTVSFSAQDALVKDHYSTNTRVNSGRIRSEAVTATFTYSLSDRIALSLSLPFIDSRYNGLKPHQDPAVNPIDGGAYHGTFQDFHFGMSYNLTRRHLAVTPFVGTIVPSHGYTSFAHSAAGRHVEETQVGVYVGRMLGGMKILPALFVQVRYAYAVAERIEGISHNRSTLDVEAGHFVGQSLRVFALGSGQVTHGGIDIPPVNTQAGLGALWPYHDQIVRENFVNVGGGASWQLSDSFDLFGSVERTVAMRNGHALSHAVSIGLTYTFAKGERARAVKAANHAAMGDACPMNDAGSSQESSLARCVCLKGR